MMAIETLPFDAADHLDRPEAQAELLNEAFASGEPAYVAAALHAVARARARTHAAAAPGGRGEIAGADLRLSDLLGTMRSLGLRLHVEPERS